MEALSMVREWLIGGTRYGPNGQNLGPVSSVSRHVEQDTGPVLDEEESDLSLVVQGRLATAPGSGLLVRLWGCRISIAYESLTALEVATLHNPDVVLFDLVLPRSKGLQIAKRLRTKAGFRSADLIALRSDGQEAALLGPQEPDFDFHLFKAMNPSELRELFAAVESEKLVEVS
jgi:CheY-like chemotaxis protein